MMVVSDVYIVTDLSRNYKSKIILKKMKQIIKASSIAACLTFAVITTHAQSWVHAGNPGFSDSTATCVSIAVDKNSIPYVVYSDAANGGKATVMKLIGSSWSVVGSKGFSAAGAGNTSIAIDTNGVPYVGFSDWGSSGKATVMKYNGTAWVNVGSAGFSANSAGDMQMALDLAGTPYVVFIEGGWGGAATVMKYSGTAWANVGTPAFTTTPIAYVSIAVDPAGAPYIAYQDGLDGAGTVQKFYGPNWGIVGGAGFTDDRTLYTQIAIDGSGVPYLVYCAFDATQSAMVRKFDGANWPIVGSAASPGYASQTAIALDGTGKPFVFFLSDDDSEKNNVMDYNGSWASVGSPDFSFGRISPDYMGNVRMLAVDKNSTPYICFEDTARGNKATVMKYGLPEEVKSNVKTAASMSLFPNPSGGTFTVNVSSPTNEDVTIIITNAIGEKVKEVTTETNQQTQIGLDSPHGLYFVNAVTKTEQLNAKVLLW